MKSFPPTLAPILLRLLSCVVASLLQLGPATATDLKPLSLPPVTEWEADSVKLATSGEVTDVSLTVNYRVGRAFSPALAVGAEDILTFQADVRSHYAGIDQSFYRCWLEMQFLKGDKVLATSTSPELIGTQPQAKLLAITSVAPKGATSVRVAFCAQNKYWGPVENNAVVALVRLSRLPPFKAGPIRLEVVNGLPTSGVKRTATAVLRGDWPNGAAVRISSTRGRTAPSIVMSNQQAEISIEYGEKDFGAALVTATSLDQKVTLRIPDPLAATLKMGSIQADGVETPALIQLIKDGVMIPGRYQQSTPGIFISAPWEIDLAPGQWQMRVRRGPEFKVLEKTLEVKSGDTVTLDKLALARKVDPRKEGWYGGDADGDVYHGERIYTDVSAETAAQISQAMGLDWAGVGNWGTPEPRTWGEAKAFMRTLSRPNFLFMWTDEKPKSQQGHACFVGATRPNEDQFGWAWSKAKRPLRNFEALKLVRESGGATFVNHPLRWWMSGEKFRTNMYSTLPFDLCAAGLLDGYNVTEKPLDLQVWSMLLDRGYQVAATTGADFGLDRPIGPVPGKLRMYCYCPEGLSEAALAAAVRAGQTVVSTGPILMAQLDGKPPGTTVKTGQTYRINAQAWARADEPDPLERLELWAHGKAIATHAFDKGAEEGTHPFSWQPSGEWDWVAVRLISKKGWAITSSFYAASPAWQAPKPVQCRVSLSVSGITDAQLEKAIVEVWDNVPEMVSSKKLNEQRLEKDMTFHAPVTATIVVRASAGRSKEVSLYDAMGMPELIARIASGVGRERPLLEWKTYEEVLQRCQQAEIKLAF